MKRSSAFKSALLMSVFLIIALSACGGGGGSSPPPSPPPAGVTITPTSVDVTESGTTATYDVVLDSLPSDDVTITVTPDAQTDLGSGAATAITLTFTSTDGTTPQTVTVTAVDDAISEGTHQSTIQHAATSVDTDYDGITIDDVTANITDNDGNITITETGGSTDIAEGSTTDTYTVVLDRLPSADVTITVTPDAQATVDLPTLTFTSTDGTTPQTVTVTAVDDGDLEGDHTATISHTAASADSSFNGSSINDVTGNITDNDRAAYTANFNGGIVGNVSAFTVDPSTGTLTEITGSNPSPYGAGVGPISVAADPRGNFLYVANEGDSVNPSDVSGYSINADGSLTEIAGGNPSPYPAGIKPGSVTVDPTGSYVYVANTNAFNNPGTISGYTLNADGSLTPITGSPFAAGINPQEITVDPTGAFAYAVNLSGDNVSGYTILANGALSPTPGSPYLTGVSPTSVKVDPSGTYLYVANIEDSVNPGTVSAYTINADGSLTPIAGSPFTTGVHPRSLAIDPAGQYLYVVSLDDSNVRGYTINVDGSLTEVTGSPFATGSTPISISIDPTGQFAYVANLLSDTVSSFSINANGSLTAVAPAASGTQPASVTTLGIVFLP